MGPGSFSGHDRSQRPAPGCVIGRTNDRRGSTRSRVTDVGRSGDRSHRRVVEADRPQDYVMTIVLDQLATCMGRGELRDAQPVGRNRHPRRSCRSCGRRPR